MAQEGSVRQPLQAEKHSFCVAFCCIRTGEGGDISSEGLVETHEALQLIDQVHNLANQVLSTSVSVHERTPHITNAAASV